MDNLNSSHPPRVFIVDDDESLRTSLHLLLEPSGFEVTAFDSAERFLEFAPKYDVGCLIVDARMPGMSGLELLEELRASESGLTSILVTGIANTSLVVQAMSAGAVTVLDKPYRESDLLEAIRRAWQLSCDCRERRIRRRVIRRRIAALSPSERQVLDLVVEGTSNKSIAGKLELSVRTVENRRRGIFQKMNAESVAELVRMILIVNDDERTQMA
jgi:FixJ family two-component response regulator